MLPAGTRLGSVKLQVASLDRSIAWYREVIGTRVLERSGPVARLGAHDALETLIELHEMPGAAPVPPRGRLGLFHVAILLPDRPALGRFASHLADLGERAGASDHGVSEALYLSDPDGLGLEIYRDRPRSEWGRHPDGRLQMGTDPIDLRAVVESAGGADWTGLPAGTTIGHLHLHVGELETGAGFYRDAIGFAPTVTEYPGALFLAADGYHHHLGTNTWARGATPARADEARLLEWSVLVPRTSDLDAAAERLTTRGFSATRESGAVLTADPWGTALRLATG